MRDVLKQLAANENNVKWNTIIKREDNLYSRGNDIRSEFERDYTRIIHSLAFRRMKHKTQVFFSPINDQKKDPNDIIVSIIPTITPLFKGNHSYAFVVDGYNIIPVPTPPNIIANKSIYKLFDKYIV